LLDTHLHSRFSIDSRAEPADYARLAGLHDYIALEFTEHLDLDPADKSCGYYDAAGHAAALAEARRLAPRTFIGRGAEFTYYPSREEQIAAYLDEVPFDYALGSVHVIDGLEANLTSRSGALEYFAATTEEEAYGRYFEHLYGAAQSGLFQALGHPDICKRYGVLFYGSFQTRRWEEELRAVFRACRLTGTGFELNVAGWGQAPAEPYPNLEGLKLAREEGVELVTVCTDAHGINRFGPLLIRRGLELLRAAGFERVYYWRERAAVPVEIADLLAGRRRSGVA
jgi:histidinol-phosphatase (PHP family)